LFQRFSDYVFPSMQYLEIIVNDFAGRI